MASISARRYQINPTTIFVGADGKLTGEAYRLMKAISNIVNAVTIDDGEVVTSMIAADAVTADKISVANLEAVSATLGNVVVDGDLIVNGTLTTPKHEANSITQGAAANGSNITVDDSDGETEIHTDDITVDFGGDVSILFNSLAGSANSKFPLTTYRLKRNGTTILTKAWYVDDIEGTRDTIMNFVDQPGTGTHTYSVTCEVAADGALGSNVINHTNVYIQLLNLKR